MLGEVWNKGMFSTARSGQLQPCLGLMLHTVRALSALLDCCRSNLLEFYASSGDFTRRLTSVKANGKFSSPSAGAQDYWTVRSQYSDMQVIGQRESHSLGCCKLGLVVYVSCVRYFPADVCLLVSHTCIRPAQAQSCLHILHTADRCSLAFTQQCLSLHAICIC